MVFALRSRFLWTELNKLIYGLNIGIILSLNIKENGTGASWLKISCLLGQYSSVESSNVIKYNEPSALLYYLYLH